MKSEIETLKKLLSEEKQKNTPLRVLARDLGLLLLRERDYTESLARQHRFDLDDAEAFRLNEALLAMVARMREAGIGPASPSEAPSGGSDKALNCQPQSEEKPHV